MAKSNCFRKQPSPRGGRLRLFLCHCKVPSESKSLPLGGKVSTDGRRMRGKHFLSYKDSAKHLINRKTTKAMKERLTTLSQQLRKNMTKEEKHLWYDFLKELPVTVNRQKVIGKYIVDFYIDSAKMIIELDGSQHYSEEGEEKDIIRDSYFKRIGIKVLRYTNRQINERFKDVCDDILLQLESRHHI